MQKITKHIHIRVFLRKKSERFSVFKNLVNKLCKPDPIYSQIFLTQPILV